MKQQEKHRKSVIEGISHAQGALPRAAKIIHRANKAEHSQLLDQALDFSGTRSARPAESDKAAESSRGNDANATSNTYADRILAVIRDADAHGVDVETALRNRLREVEERLVALETAKDSTA